MKKVLLGLTLLASTAFGQTITSVQDGNFFGLLTWDCLCLPTNGDTVIINHDVLMNAGIPYSAGTIIVNTTGSLTDGGVDKDIYINGGEFENHGLVDLDGFWLDSGYVINTGTMILDSLWTQDDMDNTGDLTTFDFLHDQFATFTNDADLNVTNNFANQGEFWNNDLMTVVNDFSNCNIQTSKAAFYTDGILCVQTDFISCDTLGSGTAGTGTIYIGGASTNTGDIYGPITI